MFPSWLSLGPLVLNFSSTPFPKLCPQARSPALHDPAGIALDLGTSGHLLAMGKDLEKPTEVLPQVHSIIALCRNVLHCLYHIRSDRVPGELLSSSDIFSLPGSSVFSQSISSVTQSCPTLCDPMDCSMPGFPVLTNSQSLLKLMSIELVMPSNHLILLLSPFPPAFNLSQHQGLFK